MGLKALNQLQSWDCPPSRRPLPRQSSSTWKRSTWLGPLIVVMLAAAVPAKANPSVGPFFQISGEYVTVDVYQTESRITGDYTFQPITNQLIYRNASRHGFARKDNQFKVSFPLILPTNGVTESQWKSLLSKNDPSLAHVIQERKDRTKPALTIDGRAFELGVHLEDITICSWLSEVMPPQSKLPSGWEFACFSQDDPYYAEKDVKVHISYVQPHLPGNISAYLPLLPGSFQGREASASPFKELNYRINFQGHEGIRFTPVGQYEVIGDASDTQISVRPKDRQLLQMRVTRGSGPPGKANSAATSP